MIEIVKMATGNEKLRSREYYALKVTDLVSRGMRLLSDYEDYSRGWIGWERPTGGKPYISKDYHNRYDPSRGETYVVSVSKGDGTII